MHRKEQLPKFPSILLVGNLSYAAPFRDETRRSNRRFTVYNAVFARHPYSAIRKSCKFKGCCLAIKKRHVNLPLLQNFLL